MASDPLDRALARCDPTTGTFKLIDWNELRQIIASNELSLLTRSPTQLHDYQVWKQETLKLYGSIEQYMLQVRLQWSRPLISTSPKSTAFTGPSDWKCLINDFPYGLEPGISHLVVWSKIKLPINRRDPEELSSEAIDIVESFIERFFIKQGQVEKDDLLYFVNPPSLKSIGNLEHFHVLLRNQQDVHRFHE